MIGVDWGTSSFRAFRLRDLVVLERVETAGGIMQIADGDFAGALRAAIGPWLAAGETQVLMCGMIGSRQGWVEAPYVDCPADAATLAQNLAPVAFAGATVAIVPGAGCAGPGGVPDVMRGEETQIVGAVDRGGARTVCLPGTHSKWATVQDGRLLGFRTAMTGEVFAALRQHTILGRMMRDGPTDRAAFLDGVRRGRAGGGLLQDLFGVRTLGLFGRLADDAAASHLSGLLIGHEIRAAEPAGPVLLVGTAALCELYAMALGEFGVEGRSAAPDAAAAGLARIAASAGWC